MSLSKRELSRRQPQIGQKIGRKVFTPDFPFIQGRLADFQPPVHADVFKHAGGRNGVRRSDRDVLSEICRVSGAGTPIRILVLRSISKSRFDFGADSNRGSPSTGNCRIGAAGVCHIFPAIAFGDDPPPSRHEQLGLVGSGNLRFCECRTRSLCRCPRRGVEPIRHSCRSNPVLCVRELGAVRHIDGLHCDSCPKREPRSQ